MTTDVRSLLLKELEMLGGEKAPKGTLKRLSLKYNIPDSTVRRWKKEEKEKKRTFEQQKMNERKKRTNEKEIAISKDILNGTTKEEIMQKYAIAERTYYEKSKNARELRRQKTEEYLNKIVDEVYPDMEVILKNIEVSKRNLTVKTTVELKNENFDFKKIENFKKAYDMIKSMGFDLMRTGKMITPYELLEIDKQLKEEELQQAKIDIEKSKNKDIETIDLTIVEDYK